MPEILTDRRTYVSFYADDGRILTPPKELEPQLKGAFPAFTQLLGHIRFFYVADEIWDGKSSLIFSSDGEQLAAVTLGDNAFYVHIAAEKFRIEDEALLDTVQVVGSRPHRSAPAIRAAHGQPERPERVSLRHPLRHVPCQ
jgi:hypothetical protein